MWLVPLTQMRDAQIQGPDPPHHIDVISKHNRFQKNLGWVFAWWRKAQDQEGVHCHVSLAPLCHSGGQQKASKLDRKRSLKRSPLAVPGPSRPPFFLHSQWNNSIVNAERKEVSIAPDGKRGTFQ